MYEKLVKRKIFFAIFNTNIVSNFSICRRLVKRIQFRVASAIRIIIILIIISDTSP